MISLLEEGNLEDRTLGRLLSDLAAVAPRLAAETIDRVGVIEGRRVEVVASLLQEVDGDGLRRSALEAIGRCRRRGGQAERTAERRR